MKNHCEKLHIMNNIMSTSIEITITFLYSYYAISFFTKLIRIHHKYLTIISALISSDITKMITVSCDDYTETQ